VGEGVCVTVRKNVASTRPCSSVYRLPYVEDSEVKRKEGICMWEREGERGREEGEREEEEEEEERKRESGGGVVKGEEEEEEREEEEEVGDSFDVLEKECERME
jgi:hypothetical protein